MEHQIELVQTSIFAPKGWNKLWKLAKKASSITPVWITVIGDSIATGAFADTTWFKDGWVSKLKSYLCGEFNEKLHAEYIPAIMHNVSTARGSATDMPWNDCSSLSPSLFEQIGWHSAYQFTQTGIELQRFIAPYDCAEAYLHVAHHSGSFDYQINGASRVTVGPPSYTFEIHKILIGPLVEGDVIKVGWQTVGTTCVTMGMTLIKSSVGIGIGRFTASSARLYTQAAYGVSHYPGGGGAEKPGVVDMWAGSNPQNGLYPITDYNYGFPTQPHLAFIALGPNDDYAGSPVADFQFAADRAVAGLRRGRNNCSVVFVINDYPDQDYSDASSKMHAPNAPLLVTSEGTTGSTNYKVKFSWESAYGLTIASDAYDVTDGPATINATDFLRVTLPTAPISAIFVRVFVSDDGGATWGFGQFTPAATVDFTNIAPAAVPPVTNGTALPNYTLWGQYVQAIYTIAVKHGCAVINIGADNGSHPYAAGRMNGKDVHPTKIGHARIFELVSSIV